LLKESIMSSSSTTRIGAVFYLNTKPLIESISDLGFKPRQRNVHYELLSEEIADFAVQANRKRIAELKAEQAGVYSIAK
jgi:hypothetical protein